jgi:hypothetical protein
MYDNMNVVPAGPGKAELRNMNVAVQKDKETFP